MADSEWIEEIRANRECIIRLNEVVFNGYGEAIRDMKERMEATEKKVNWFFATFTTLQIAVIGILLRAVL